MPQHKPFEKQSYEEIDLSIDWVKELPPAVTIASATVTVAELLTGTVVTDALSYQPPTWNTSLVTVRTKGGVHGLDYNLSFRIVLSDGQRYENDWVLRVRDVPAPVA